VENAKIVLNYEPSFFADGKLFIGNRQVEAEEAVAHVIKTNDELEKQFGLRSIDYFVEKRDEVAKSRNAKP
jgi:hypothetical protein